MNLSQYIESLKRDPSFMSNVACWREVPAREARFMPFPEGIDPRIVAALEKRGIETWYYTTHLHQGAFMLPKYVEDIMKEEE